eukprot:TRINITY_DN9253_c0_g4_i2.p1 TRINITY_DN9253_c0_g4~~TRINITY_DN9253_c0_g4_i2.p1  ORF type:complete len:392 (+),score=57.12 TRINITY_DN9253_c0_g4_i2:347-1522(+)
MQIFKILESSRMYPGLNVSNPVPVKSEWHGYLSLTALSVLILTIQYLVSPLKKKKKKKYSALIPLLPRKEESHIKTTSRVAFPYLASLNLSRCLLIKDSGITNLSRNSPNLTKLVVASCQDITDQSVLELSSFCKKLANVDFSNCNRLTDISLSTLASSCLQLRKCNLYNCNLVTDATIEALTEFCPGLEHLNISCCGQLTDKSIEKIASCCPRLRHLWLEECNITTEGLSHLNICSNLKSLNLGYSKGLNDAVLVMLAEGCPKMKKIDLSYCNKITAACLGKVLRAWPLLKDLNLRGFSGELHELRHPNLENLNLSWCNMVDDAIIGVIADCSNLVGLDLAWNSKITANSVHKLASKCKSLRSLNLRGCTRVSMLAIQYLSRANGMVIYR